jgi:hypothetical protein
VCWPRHPVRTHRINEHECSKGDISKAYFDIRNLNIESLLYAITPVPLLNSEKLLHFPYKVPDTASGSSEEFNLSPP